MLGEETVWMSDVHEFRPPALEPWSIWLRHGRIVEGSVVPTPELHPCCELGVILEGSVLNIVSNDEVTVLPGDVLLVPPNLPHDHRILSYPLRYFTAFFQPSLLLDQAPEKDGRVLLDRFLSQKTLRRRHIRPSKELRPFILEACEGMISESEAAEFGSGIRIRLIFFDLLVRICREEILLNKETDKVPEQSNWPLVCKALAYIAENFAEEIYSRDLAKYCGTSESRLRAYFHHHMGTPWGAYLRTIRVKHACALLAGSKSSVLEIAHECGFQTLSHFNSQFQEVLGCTPTQYRKGRGGSESHG